MLTTADLDILQTLNRGIMDLGLVCPKSSHTTAKGGGEVDLDEDEDL